MCMRVHKCTTECVTVCASVFVCERERERLSECMYAHLCGTGTGVEVGDLKDGPIKTNLLVNIKHVVLHK